MSKPKQLLISLAASLVVLLTPAVAFAHVIVTPKQAGIGEELTFNVSVPNERETAVTNVKLLIPQGVTDVIPTTTPNWEIMTSKNGDQITSLTWQGTIPVGQRMDFSFSAQVPANAGEVDWKAYQTYADGTVVHWDQKPAGSDDATGNAGPYSVTQVINDLSSTTKSKKSISSTDTAMIISLAALAIAVVSLVLARKNK